ncbi:DNA polymerase III subunit alpha [Gandjariella thermophila]|uniref:DNA polymerase III subunit alpha n=1 Tax=Gandjariella thermophila TaxID=1931992 RepID=A0A4D4J927_9PSEU|nr:DNA polymerase III subunit alpha [Gandjariella thermophila]GDY30457.1 DNA-directed DNA polymerase [Gandjariella thermophila]
MAGASFVHLHVHTEYSMLDGAAKVAPLFAEAARLGMPAVGMTDHGNMYGAAEFYQQAKKSGIKPIIGIEAYVAPASRFHKKPVFWGNDKQRGVDEFGEGGDVSGGGAYTHMTMLARNTTGLRNLFKLSSLASFEGQYRKPRMDKELIAEHAEGIIATTGCPSGEVQTRLRLGQRDEALKAAADYRDIFGPENFFLELMDHGLSIERSVREGLLDIARKLDLNPLATNDSHYVTKDQAESHAALLCVQSGKTLDDPNRFKFDGDGYYLKSAEEMREYWDSEVPGAADNTLLVAERIESYDEMFAYRDRMPRVPVPPGKTEADLLREEVEQYLPTRFPNGITQEYRDRIEWELEVICGKGYASYFLVVGDLVRWAKSQGIRVGPGRGSATGALVSYILHIINLDPIEHSLIFERFLNPERDSPPDIDLDFDDRRRDEVAAYVRDKYGAENFAQVITFGTIKTKAAIKDSARVHFGQPGYSIADRITKALPPPVAAKDIPLSGIVDPEHPRYSEAAEVRSLIETDNDVKRIFETARGLEGLIRNAGVHACAHILSSEPLLDVLPLWMRPDDGAVITGWDYEPCESIGLLKMDLLGLSTLTIIDDTIRAVKANHGREIDLDTLRLDDKATYELLARGDTLGVFQLDGGGMRTLLKAIAPTHFGDVSAALALYRPGPMAVNAHMDYAARSNGRARITPIHPELRDALDPILGETYHLLVYQEQVMAIAQQLAGYTMGQADLLRKAMGKKKPEVIAKEEEKFLGGMREKGFSDEAARTLWEVMLPFAGYAFNKSHTAGYALVSYWTAYLKTHYPAEFMAAQLTSNADNKDKSAVYLAECRRMGVKVLPPDVNQSAVHFSAVNGNIRFGLGAVRNVGTGVAESIIRTREKAGAYTSFADFLTKVDPSVCSKRVVESLIKAGAFDSLGVTRKALLAVYEEAVEAVSALKRQQAMGQFDLFGSGADAEEEGTSPLAHLRYDPEEMPRKQLLGYEREMLGLYVSAHPLDGAENVLRKHAPQPIATLLDEAPKDGEVVISGMISSVERRVNKNGEPWAIVIVEDLDASVEVLFFAKSYMVLHEDLVQDTAVAVKGRVNWRDDRMSIFGSGVIPLDISEAALQQADDAQPFVLRVEPEHVTEDNVSELRSTLAAHRGEIPVRLVLSGRQDQMFALDQYPVTVSSALLGELKSIRGFTVAS